MSLQSEPENQYEVTFCVHDEETNICTRHGTHGQHTLETGAYTVMNSSPTSDVPNVEPTDAYSLANDAMPSENATSLRSYTVSGRLSSPAATTSGQDDTKPYYTTVTARNTNVTNSNQAPIEHYRFAGDVAQPSRNSRLNHQLSIPASIPEVPPRTKESERSASFYSTIQENRFGVLHLLGIVIIVIITAIIALSLGIASLLQIGEIRNSLLHLTGGQTLPPPIVSTKHVPIEECSAGNKNDCHEEGGMCVETINGFGCFCKDGWSGNGRNCTEITYRTCTSLKKVVGFNTGYYSISPDPGNVEPLLVKCVMNKDRGVTEIGHDSENAMVVNGCESPGCYARNITYEATMDQIVAVIKASTYCSQYFKYECYHAALAIDGKAFGWWVSRIGTNETRWVDGADENSCACSKVANSTCPGCNCNANDSKHRLDEGYLSNKTLLPVMQLRFGEVEEVWEEGHHTLGKLRCYD